MRGRDARDGDPRGGDSRVAIVEPLRGLAALAVCWFHFTAAGSVLPPGALRTSGTYGWLGVECFFVISAFVIPLSMYRGGFALRTGWRTFLAKRVTRLDPPYLVAVAVAASVALLYASARTPGFAGRPPALSVPQLLAHLGYLNAFFGYDWVNPVFWTLAIEFQYYVLIALVYGLVAARDRRARVAAVVGLGALGLVPAPEAYVVHFLATFALGIATFQHHVGLIGRPTYAALLPSLAAAAWWSLGPAAAAVATALTIASVRMRVPRVLLFFGAISYSLSLLYVPVGTRVVSLGGRVAHGAAAPLAVVLGALAVSVGAAYAMYRWVERPAQLWSASFRYGAGSPERPLTVYLAHGAVPCPARMERP